MKVFRSIFVPVFPGEPAWVTEGLALSALQLGRWFDAEVSFLSPAQSRRRLDSLLSRFDKELAARIPAYRVVPIERERAFVDAALSVISERLERAVICLAAERRGMLFPVQELPERKEELAERAHAPILVLPPGIRLGYPPALSALVPMSGERRASESLHLAIRLGNSHRIPVDLLHVTGTRRGQSPSNRLALLSDEFYHEYPRMIEDFIEEASPYSTMEERLVIREFSHVFGNVLDYLRRTVRKDSKTLLIVEWKGTLCHGHGQAVRMLLRRTTAPVLLVREELAARSRLKVGDQFGAAR